MIHRKLLFLVALLPLAGCQVTAYDSARQMAYDQQQLASILGTRTPQPMQRCLHTNPGMDLRTIGNTIVARDGAQISINQPSGNCSEASQAGAVLVLEPDAGGLYCANTSVRVVSNGGMQIGSCLLNNWTPYR